MLISDIQKGHNYLISNSGMVSNVSRTIMCCGLRVSLTKINIIPDFEKNFLRNRPGCRT